MSLTATETTTEQHFMCKREFDRLPLIGGCIDQEKTMFDFVFTALHELDMYDEDQESPLTARQATKYRAFVQKWAPIVGLKP